MVRPALAKCVEGQLHTSTRLLSPADFTLSTVTAASASSAMSILYPLYSLRLIKIFHVIQAVNCEIGEITIWNPLRIHRNINLDTEMCANPDLDDEYMV